MSSYRLRILSGATLTVEASSVSDARAQARILAGEEWLTAIEVIPTSQPVDRSFTAGVPVRPGRVLTFTSFGDSISAQVRHWCQYDPAVKAHIVASVPDWKPSTTVALNNLCLNANNVYYCSTAGVTGTGSGPTAQTASAITDGTAAWTIITPAMNKDGYQYWAEACSLGALVWDQNDSFAGVTGSLLKVIVAAGGAGYKSTDTLVFNNGVRGELVVKDGAVVAVHVTNAGRAAGAAFTVSITSATGSGAVLVPVEAGHGVYASPGATALAAKSFLPDVVAASHDVVVVLLGTNDVAAGRSAEAIVSDLEYIYETLMLAGKLVVAVPILPRASGYTALVADTILRINRWIRAYTQGESWANPRRFSSIALADPTINMTDMNDGRYWPIGGTSLVTGGVTTDGLHPNTLGRMLIGFAIWDAIEKTFARAPLSSSRSSGSEDGYDPIRNPGGNTLEGPGWIASTAVIVGSQCSNNNNVYRCITAGTTASSGGPSGTGTNIADGSAVWNYMQAAKKSIMATGTAGVIPTVGGVVGSGALCTGFVVNRLSGTASGTVVGAVENPWSTGQRGSRQTLTFSLGSGDALERWDLILHSFTAANANIQPAELGVQPFVAACEVEVSNLANVTRFYLSPVGDSVPVLQNYVGGGIAGAGQEMLPSVGPTPYPNNGRLKLISSPFIIPHGLVSAGFSFTMGFNTSGGAGSATLTVKFNYFELRRFGKL